MKRKIKETEFRFPTKGLELSITLHKYRLRNKMLCDTEVSYIVINFLYVLSQHSFKNLRKIYQL